MISTLDFDFDDKALNNSSLSSLLYTIAYCTTEFEPLDLIGELKLPFYYSERLFFWSTVKIGLRETFRKSPSAYSLTL